MSYLPGLGVYVPRATQVLGDPAGADPSPRDIFTITGVVQLTMIVGVVTVVMDASACTLQLQHSDNTVAMCVALAAIASDGVNTIYCISGDPADLMYKLELGVAGVGRGGMHGGVAAGGGVIANGMIAAPGNIEMVWSATQTGSVAWYLTYLPITPGANVVVA